MLFRSIGNAAINDKTTFKKELAKEIATSPAEDKKSVTAAAISGSADLMSDITALAGRTGMMDIPKAEEQIAKYNKISQEAYTPPTEGWSQAPVEHIKQLAGQSAPYMVAPVIAGLTAAEAPLTGVAATVLPTLASFGTSYGQFVGSNLSRQLDEGVKLADTNLQKAGLAAVPQAALDTISLHMLPGTRMIFQKAGIELTDAALDKIAKQSLLAKAGEYLMTTGKAMTTEGLTEAAQQIFERWQAGLSLTDEKEIGRAHV